MVVLCKEERSWMHGTIIGYRSEDQNSRCNKIRVIKTGCIIIRTKQHVTANPISTEDYIRIEVQKDNKQQLDGKLSELKDRFAKLHNDEQLNIMELDRKDKEPKVIQPTEKIDTVHDKRPTQSMANKALHEKEFHSQTKNWESIIMTISGWISRKLERPSYF